MADRWQDTPAGQQAQQNQEKEKKAEQQKDHDRLIESDQVKRNSVPIDRAHENGKTPFVEYSINGLRKMILNSQPGKISEVGGHWKMVHNILSGGDGDGKTGAVDQVSDKGSVAGMLQTAVDTVLEHWEGEAAQAFKRRADNIAGQIRNGAAYANFTAEQLFAASKDLDAAKSKMEDIHEPSMLESAGDKMNDNDDRDDSQAKRDLAAGVSADTIAKANEKNLSLGMERRLQAMAVMEELATNYKVYSQNLNNNKWINEKEQISPPNNNVTMPPPISVPSASSGGPSAGRVTNKPWSAGSTTSIKPAPTVPRNPGITGGAQLPTGSPELPAARTNVDSISPGLPGTGPSTGVGGASVGGLGTGGVQSAGIGVPGGAAGLAGGSAGGIGAVAGRGGLAGGAAAGRGAGGRAGMGGMGGGAGAAGRGGASAGGRGALARARGGVVGAAKGVGKGAGGGAGLHGSRGGTQAGAAGGAGGKRRRSEKENGQGDRPDYLVEDEETWISEEDRNRNLPRTIE